MVPLPQTSSYGNLGILICGGSTPNGVVLDNCVSIVPEATNPTWVLERMVGPSPSHVTASDEYLALKACDDLHG